VTPLVVLDACSIINFAVIDQAPLLTRLLADRGRWTEGVEHEVRRHRDDLPFGCLAEVRSALGTPYEFDSISDGPKIELLRRALGGTSRKPLTHYGEAESIHAVLSLPELKEAEVLTDDDFAAQLARQRGIRVISTPKLLRRSWEEGLLDCPQPFDLLVEMQARGRWLPVPSDHHAICPT
jgi:predicted nucleic acid-binding protein